jgi:hypothetical protein
MPNISTCYIYGVIPVEHCWSLTQKSHTRYITITVTLYKKKFLWRKYNDYDIVINANYISDQFYDGEYSTNSTLKGLVEKISSDIQSVCSAYDKDICTIEDVKEVVIDCIQRYKGTYKIYSKSKGK